MVWALAGMVEWWWRRKRRRRRERRFRLIFATTVRIAQG
jgi:hypothetical protein